MDVREKLFTLFQDCNNPSWKWFPNNAEMLKLIDYLIANGVTVQGWIPVTERLPDNSATVNLCTRSKIVGTGFYNKYTKSWVQYYSGGAICVDVTHWQPMPQPPKGE